MTVVVDASVVVAALLDRGPTGAWAEALLLSGDELAAPHHMPVETANVLRRAELAGDISADVAALAHDDLASLRCKLFPHASCASRVWELRSNITAYDAWYVALAESRRGIGHPRQATDPRPGDALPVRCAAVGRLRTVRIRAL